MTPVRKHTGKRVFTLADTLQFFMFPPQPLQGKRNTFYYMFPTDVPETCFFVPSSGGNVKILSGNLTGFSVFPAVSVAVSA